MKEIKICDLSFSYPASPEKWILKDISLTIEAGEFVCLLGQCGHTGAPGLEALYPGDSADCSRDWSTRREGALI